MIAASLHPQEDERLRALHRLNVLDTPAERQFDDLVALAATIAETKIALISLVDSNRQWFKAKYGLDADETSRDVAFCAHAILDVDSPLLVEDSHLDSRFADNPLVCNVPHVRFYLGIPLRDPQTGLPLGTLCVIDDEPRKFDLAKLPALTALARQVEALFSLLQRNAELQRLNEELRIARAEAEFHTQQKSRFLATLSHEIRTPMNGILGTVDLMSEEVPPQLADRLDTIRSCGTSLLHLINDVLDLSKIEAGHFEIHRTATDVSKLVTETASVVRTLANKKRLEIRTTITGPTRAALLDGPRLHQVLLNLLSNAIKFTPAGTIELGAHLTAERLELRVKDSGPGLSPSDQARVFEPFVQTSTGVAAAGGTGLGLSICRGLIHAMGGTIELVSALGAGCEFVISVPTRLESCEESRPQPALGDVDLTGLRVLVADDNIVNVKVLVGMLDRIGVHQVVVANNGAEAVASHHRADIVLMDCHMPVLDGLDATRAIRAQEQGVHKPIVALTASAFESDRVACEAAGMDALITKPVRRDVLRDTLARFVVGMRVHANDGASRVSVC